MSTIHNLSGYGPKNAPEQTREPKVNLSFAHKLPKADFKDVPGMKLYLDVLTQVLPSVSMPAAALARGYDFKNVDEDDMDFTQLMKDNNTEKILDSHFIESHPKHEEAVTFGQQYSGRELIRADQIVRSTLALSSEQETLITLGAFRSGVEKIENIRTTLMLKTHSETVHLFNFLGTNNFNEYDGFAQWSAAIHKKWLQIDWDSIDHFDILKFVLTNVSRKYKPIMQEILLYHPDADYQEINNLVSKWEEMNRTLGARWKQNSNAASRNPSVSANSASITRSDGTPLKCYLCGEIGHKADQCPDRGKPKYSERRHDHHMERADRQGKNRQQSRPPNRRAPWKANQERGGDMSAIQKQLDAQQSLLEKLTTHLNKSNKSVSANSVTEVKVSSGDWAGVAARAPNARPKIFDPHRTNMSVNMINIDRNPDSKPSSRIDVKQLSSEERGELMHQLLQLKRSELADRTSGKLSPTSDQKLPPEEEALDDSPVQLDADGFRSVAGDDRKMDDDGMGSRPPDSGTLITPPSTPTMVTPPKEKMDASEENSPVAGTVVSVTELDDLSLSAPPSAFRFSEYEQSLAKANAAAVSDSKYSPAEEEVLFHLLLNRRSAARNTLVDKIEQTQHELASLREQLRKFREPISTLLQERRHGSGSTHNPNWTNTRPKQWAKPQRIEQVVPRHRLLHQSRQDSPAQAPKRNTFQRRKQSKAFRNKERAKEIAKIQQRLSRQTPKRSPPKHDRRTDGAGAYMLSTASKTRKNEWYLDSGAASSFVNSRKYFRTMHQLDKPLRVNGAIRGSVILCHQYGTLSNGLEAYYAPDFQNNLISAQQLSQLFGPLLLSENAIKDDRGTTIATHDGDQYIIDETVFLDTNSTTVNAVTTTKATIEDLQLLFRQTGAPGLGTMAALHKHMEGLPASESSTIRTLYKHHAVVESIAQSRQVATSFKTLNKLDPRAFHFLEKICSDTAHEPEHVSLGDHSYWEVIKDYFSNWKWVILLNKISDLADELPKFLERIQNKCGRSVRIYKTDNHLCYKNATVQNYLAQHGITHETNIPRTSQQNGRAESAIRDIRRKARTLLIQAHLPIAAWAFAVVEAARIANLLPCSSNPDSKSPYEMVTGEKANRSQLLVFGSIAWARIHPDKRAGKMDPVATPYIYVGQDSKGFILWDPRMEDEVSTFHAVHVYFDQSCTWTTDYVREIAHELPITRTTPATEHHITSECISLNVNDESMTDDDTVALRLDTPLASPLEGSALRIQGSNDKNPTDPDKIPSEKPSPSTQSETSTPEQPPRSPSKSKEDTPRYNLRSRLRNAIGKKKAQRTRRRVAFANSVNISKVNWMDAKDHYEVGVDEACRIPVPRNLNAALEHPQWREAVLKEVKSIMDNGTFKIVDPTTQEKLPRKLRRLINKAIRCHFVFRAKPDKNGKLLKFKARLVANGNNQQEGVNYFSSYAPVAGATTIKTQIAHGLMNKHIMESWDYSSAYLNAILQETIFITLPGIPSEYGITIPPGCRLLLVKSIYGLVQAGHEWNQRLKKSLEDRGFKQCPYEPGLFIKRFDDGSVIVITTYVDDLLLTSDSQAHLDDEYKHLSADLPIGNREELSWHIGMHFQRFGNSMTIDQSAYIIETINEFNMASAKGRRTPRKLELQLSHHDAPKDEETYNEAQKLPYRKLVGKLMYLSQQSRPDISEATSASGKFFANWGTIHWNAAKDIVRYLRTSHLLPLVYHPKRKNSPLEIYVDAAYANDIDNRYSQTGIAIFYYDCLVGWASRRQKSVTLSSCEAEYVALTDAAKEAIHLRRIVAFIDKDFNPDVPTTIFEDNQGTIALAYSDGKTQARTKHIDIRMHFVRDYVREGTIDIQWVATDMQKADFYTKPLAGPKHEFMRNLNMSCDLAPSEYNRKMTPAEDKLHQQTGLAPGELRSQADRSAVAPGSAPYAQGEC